MWLFPLSRSPADATLAAAATVLAATAEPETGAHELFLLLTTGGRATCHMALAMTCNPMFEASLSLSRLYRKEARRRRRFHTFITFHVARLGPRDAIPNRKDFERAANRQQ